jgi:hypothetical protein
MNTRTQSFLITALLLTAPMLTQANSDAAMDACVKAFVSTSLEKERPFSVRKEESVDSPIDQHSRAYRISLKAVGKHSGKQVAKATCVVDRSGVVLSMNGKSLATPTLASSR